MQAFNHYSGHLKKQAHLSICAKICNASAVFNASRTQPFLKNSNPKNQCITNTKESVQLLLLLAQHHPTDGDDGRHIHYIASTPLNLFFLTTEHTSCQSENENDSSGRSKFSLVPACMLLSVVAYLSHQHQQLSSCSYKMHF